MGESFRRRASPKAPMREGRNKQSSSSYKSTSNSIFRPASFHQLISNLAILYISLSNLVLALCWLPFHVLTFFLYFLLRRHFLVNLRNLRVPAGTQDAYFVSSPSQLAT